MQHNIIIRLYTNLWQTCRHMHKKCAYYCIYCISVSYYANNVTCDCLNWFRIKALQKHFHVWFRLLEPYCTVCICAHLLSGKQICTSNSACRQWQYLHMLTEYIKIHKNELHISTVPMFFKQLMYISDFAHSQERYTESVPFYVISLVHLLWFSLIDYNEPH